MLIVQKYGGATLSTPEKIKAVAARIARQAKAGHQVVVTVSAMGNTTNELIALAQNVSEQPNLREMDMLLSTGERISMALVSMALLDCGCDSISLTGSQSGILTNEAHINASIKDVKAFRVIESLKEGKVVVLAGFQGVSPETKEITTLGRGGTDTTAIAMASFLKANRCEILKDVPGVMTADPKIVKSARTLNDLSFETLAEMCFWGAKVMHYRSVELAWRNKINVLVGAAANENLRGTMVSENLPKYESVRILGLNSHSEILKVTVLKQAGVDLAKATTDFFIFLDINNLGRPQILMTENLTDGFHFWLTSAQEILTGLQKKLSNEKNYKIETNWCSVSATCSGSSLSDLMGLAVTALQDAGIQPRAIWTSAMSITFILDRPIRETAINKIHELVAL